MADEDKVVQTEWKEVEKVKTDKKVGKSDYTRTVTRPSTTPAQFHCWHAARHCPLMAGQITGALCCKFYSTHHPFRDPAPQ